MNDDYFDDDFNGLDYDWLDMASEARDVFYDDAKSKKIVNDIDYMTFMRFNDKDKLTYLYNKIRDLYSYLSAIQDVV